MSTAGLKTSEISSAEYWGRYRLISRIARGGMGDVYLAFAEGVGGFSKLVVIKELRRELALDNQMRDALMAEGRVAALLNHPNIVQTIDVDAVDDHVFIVMEHLDGQPLDRVRERFAHQGGLPLPLQLSILADVLAGLHYAHSMTNLDGIPLDLVHRDISPSNVFITYEGNVKVIDFGIAKAYGIATVRGQKIKGKVRYATPEQVRGRPVDRRADIFSVGVLLWEALAGRSLWPADMGDHAVIANLLNGAIPSVREAAPTAPDELLEICEKALSVKPFDRYPTAEAMQSALDDARGKLYTSSTSSGLGRTVAAAFDTERHSRSGMVRSSMKLKDAMDASGQSIAPSRRASIPPPVSTATPPSQGMSPRSESETRPHGFGGPPDRASTPSFVPPAPPSTPRLSSDTAPKPATDDDLATSPWNSLAIGIALTVGIIIGVLLGGLQRNLTPSTESHLPANTSFSQTSQSVEVIASCISEAQSSDRRCEFRINEQALQPWQNDGLGAADPASKTQTLRFRMLPNTVAPFGTATMPTNSPKGTR